MKKIQLIAIIIIALGCGNKYRSPIPHFSANISVHDLSAREKLIVDGKEISIGYYTSSDLHDGPLTIRALILKNGTWYKTESRFGIIEEDSSSFATQTPAFIEKDVTSKKRVTDLEASLFIDMLTKNNLFNLPDDHILLKKGETNCSKKMRRFKDAGWIVFWIASGHKIRKLKFDYPEYRANDCPEMEEWKNIIALQNLFENEWFHKQH